LVKQSVSDGYPRQATRKQEKRPSLGALALLFLKFGAIGFGGGLAVVALLEQELIQRRKLMDPEEFLHGVALGQILGPAAVNTAFFLGHRRFGMLGALACAGAFLAPSVALVILLSWLYFSFHALPALQTALLGLGPVVIALISSAAWSMGRKAVRTWPAGLLVALALVLVLFKVNSLLALLGGAAAGLWAGKSTLGGRPNQDTDGGTTQPLLALGVFPLKALAIASALGGMAWTFLKVGFLFFGGGFVLVPILHQRLVVSLGWLSPREFLDGVAISNLTPGPIAVLATFAGYKMHGVLGAVVATLALFAPALVLMAILSHFYSRLKDLHQVQNLLAGLAPTVVGLILGAAALLAPGALHGLGGWVFFIGSLVLLLRYRWHPAFVLGLGALAGVVGWVR
jgi:chromate transporter